MDTQKKGKSAKKKTLMKDDYCKEYGGHCSRDEKIKIKFSPEEIEKWGKRIIVISGPPGSGKDTVVEECIKKNPKLKYFIPTTTRQPRPGEKDIRYHFVSEKEFKKRKANRKFLFWQDHGKDTKGHAKYYGILNFDLKKQLAESDKDIVITVGGVCGAMEIKRIFPKAATIFIMPDPIDILEKKIRSRGIKSEKEIKASLQEGRIMMRLRNFYDFEVKNIYEHLNEAVKEVLKISQQRRE